MFKTIIKTYKIASLSRELDPNKSVKGDTESIREQMEKRNRTERELWAWIESDRELKPVLEKYRASKEELALLYKNLLQHGAGQWVKEQLVCVSAFVNPKTLDYLLRHKNEKDFSKVVFRLTEYFREEETGEIID